MAETRAPDQMPVDWQVKTFAPEQGFGTLVHASGEEVIFNIDAWDLAGWKPSRKELLAPRGESPSMPRVGEPVRVGWKRSRSGKNVPALVQPTARAPATNQHTLADWLAGVQRIAERFTGVTKASMLAALSRLDLERADAWRDSEARDAGEFAYLVMDLRTLEDRDPAWVLAHASWIYTDDHRWDRERARDQLSVMLGLREAPIPADDAESLSDYVARCNAVAPGHVRLHELELDGDAHVFVALTSGAFDALVVDGYLAATRR